MALAFCELPCVSRFIMDIVIICESLLHVTNELWDS